MAASQVHWENRDQVPLIRDWVRNHGGVATPGEEDGTLLIEYGSGVEARALTAALGDHITVTPQGHFDLWAEVPDPELLP